MPSIKNVMTGGWFVIVLPVHKWVLIGNMICKWDFNEEIIYERDIFNSNYT
jgi:hypothetical protein